MASFVTSSFAKGSVVDLVLARRLCDTFTPRGSAEVTFAASAGAVASVGVDGRGYLTINELARDTPSLHGVAAAYALWGGLVALALLVVAGWLAARRRHDGPAHVATAFLAGAAAVVALAVNRFISAAVARPRPFHRFPHAEVLLARPHDFSFPSDHCMIAGAFAAGLLLLDRRLGALAAVLALVLAFARVYAGVHYPSDVVVGLLAGAAIGAAIGLTLHTPAAAAARRLTRTPLRPLVCARRAASACT
jgi:membrane-associated phospholipid phosphatase